MEKDLLRRLFLEGELIRPERELLTLQPENVIVVSLDGKLYALTVQIDEVPMQ